MRGGCCGAVRAVAGIVAWVAVLGGLGPSLGVAAEPGIADHPLRRHREGLARGSADPRAVAGAVISVEEGQMRTTLSWRDLEARGARDGDRIDLVIGERILPARLLTADGYRRLRGDQEALAAVDVDVVSVQGPDEGVVLLGLSGDLAAFLGAYPGMPVALRLR